MLDLRQTALQWGLRVSAREAMYNDGGFPEHAPDALLVAAGEIGEIVNVGMHEETQTPIYLVEFAVGVIGCLEEEIAVVDPALAAAPVP